MVSTSSTSQPRPLRAFLSHSYGAPAINLRFFEVFAQAAQVQFSVDLGKLDTNVTRLERLVRDADVFIGVYPLPADAPPTLSRDALRQHSRYFRLELDLAVRAGLPAIVFADARYGNVLACPEGVRRLAFDAQQIQADTWGPQMQVLAKAFESFNEAALAYQAWRIDQAVNQRERTRVGLLLPPDVYPAELRQSVRDALEDIGREVVELPWPPQLSGAFYAQLGNLDWIVVDVGDDPASAGVAGFLHGNFVPAIRLVKVDDPAAPVGTLRRALYGGVDAGYPKDVVAWHDAAELQTALAARLASLLAPQRLIDSTAAAVAYFGSAALRKELIFVSYAGVDAAAAQPVIAALKRQFKTVFDYKDGQSIVPGKPWLEEIFNTLTRSAVAVMLLSPGYLASGNCAHEAREIVARHDDGRLALLPVRLSNDKLDTPPWLQQTQHARLADLPDAAAVAALVLGLLDEAKPA